MAAVAKIFFISLQIYKNNTTLSRGLQMIGYLCCMKLIFATANLHKLQEASEILGPGFELSTPAANGLTDEIPETGNTLEANSLQKASFIHEHLGVDCFADDSGLEVDFLGGAPGVYTARYAAGEPQYKDNLEKLLHVMKDVPWEKRTARFRAVVTLIIGNEVKQFEGVLEGRIGTERKGNGGFGYDPIFIPNEIPEEIPDQVGNDDGPWKLVPNTLGIANAELPEGGKNAISHRGQCMRAMAEYLKSRK